MTKYKQAFDEMITFNKDLFDEFKKIHDNFVLDASAWNESFQEKGKEILRIIQRTDNRLCMKSESGKYGKFSSNLSEKFWEEVRKHFPKIDYIGAK